MNTIQALVRLKLLKSFIDALDIIILQNINLKILYGFAIQILGIYAKLKALYQRYTPVILVLFFIYSLYYYSQ